MDWGSVGKTLEKVLPYAVTAFGGPAGPALGGILATALGTSNTPDAVQAAIADPASADKILAYEVQIKTIIANQQVADHAADVDNTKNARALAIAKSDWPQITLSFLFIGGYFGILAMIIEGAIHIPADFHDVFEQALGALLSSVTMIVVFWFGSTKSSQRNSEAATQAAIS